MRFVAPSPITVALRDPIEEPDPYHPGRRIVHRAGLRAQFVTSDFTLHEKETAISRFKFNGIPLDEFTQTPLDPSYRISTLDTELQNWSDEDREYAEEFLLKHPQHGSDFLLVELPKLTPPWAGYDKLAADKIVMLVQDTGSDIEDVIAYERSTKNRKSLIQSLEELIPVPDPDEVVVSA